MLKSKAKKENEELYRGHQYFAIESFRQKYSVAILAVLVKDRD